MAQLNSLFRQTIEGEVPKLIRKILRQNQEVFKEIIALPPRRSHNHKIILKPDAQPVNLRSYCYPYHHKIDRRDASYRDCHTQSEFFSLIGPTHCEEKWYPKDVY